MNKRFLILVGELLFLAVIYIGFKWKFFDYYAFLNKKTIYWSIVLIDCVISWYLIKPIRKSVLLKKEYGKSIILIILFLIFWFTILPYVLYKNIGLERIDWILICFVFSIFFIPVFLLAIKDLPDIKVYSGVSRWKYMNKKEYGLVVSNLILFIISAIFAYYKNILDIDYSGIISVTCGILGIFCLYLGSFLSASVVYKR